MTQARTLISIATRRRWTVSGRALSVAISILGFGHATFAAADGHMNDSPDVKYRQTLMSNIGSNMGAIGDILKNRLMLPGHVEAHALQLAESSKLIAAAFKKNVATDATDAKPEIWTDWAKFESAIADLEQSARTLATAAAAGDSSAIGPAVKALGKSCGGCHKPFRKPKEESFRRKMP